MRLTLTRTLLRTAALAASIAVASALPAQTTAPVKPKPAPTVVHKPAAAASATLVDINHASADELKAVPGIGDAYAAKIIAGRPYASKSQLLSKKIVTSSVYKKIEAKLVARQQ